MKQDKVNIWIWLLQRALALGLSVAFTIALLLVLPLMQTIANPMGTDLVVRNVDVGSLPPPPPPPPPEEEIEGEEPEEQPPQLLEEAPPLDLGQLELALNPGFGDAVFADLSVDLVNQLAGAGGDEEVDRVFSLADLDQQPRVLFQRSPRYPPELLRAKRTGTVYVVFMVDKEGRVQSPTVQKSTDPAFDRAAVDAVKQWKFEPGTRKGKGVAFKMRVPITFNAG